MYPVFSCTYDSQCSRQALNPWFRMYMLTCVFSLLTGLFWRIWHMDLVQSAVLYAVMTLVSTYLVAFAYKNVKFVLKHKYEPPWVFSLSETPD